MIRQQQFQVTERGGAIFSVGTDPPDEVVFRSKVFSNDERLFLQENLRTYELEFSAESTCHLFVRCLFHLQAQQVKKGADGTGVKQRHGNFVLFLHDFGSLSNCWCWMKFALFLYQKGMDLIFLDFPGFGKSSVGENTRCPPSLWERFAAPIVSHLLDELNIMRVNTVSVGEGSGVVFKFIAKYPHRSGKYHVCYNPVIRPDDHRAALRPSEFERLITGHPKPFFWITWDTNTYGQRSHTHAVPGFDETMQRIKDYARLKNMKDQFSLADISRKDLAKTCCYETQEVGEESKFCLVPRKYFRIYICSILTGLKLPPYAAMLNAPGQYKWTLVPGHDEEDNPIVYGGQLHGLAPVGQTGGLERAASPGRNAVRLNTTSQTNTSSAPALGDTSRSFGKSTMIQDLPEQVRPDASELELARFYRKREQRLAGWFNIPVNPDMSYGARIANESESKDMKAAVSSSVEQYLREYGEEEDEIERARQYSMQTFSEEEEDERLKDLRSRPPDHEFEALQALQQTVEESLDTKDMYELSDEAAFNRALEISMRETDLMSMLQPRSDAAHSAVAERAAIDKSMASYLLEKKAREESAAGGMPALTDAPLPLPPPRASVELPSISQLEADKAAAIAREDFLAAHRLTQEIVKAKAALERSGIGSRGEPGNRGSLKRTGESVLGGPSSMPASGAVSRGASVLEPRDRSPAHGSGQATPSRGPVSPVGSGSAGPSAPPSESGRPGSRQAP